MASIFLAEVKKYMAMLIDFIKKSWLAVVSALVFGLLVSGVHGMLKEEIKQNAIDAMNKNRVNLFGEGCEYIKDGDIVLPDDSKIEYFKAVKDAEHVGYTLVYSGGGFADKITLVLGYDKDITKLLGYEVLKCLETPGFGDKIKYDSDGEPDPVAFFKDRFVARSVKEKLAVVKGDPIKYEEGSSVVAISGSTISSQAVVSIVNKATKYLRRATGK